MTVQQLLVALWRNSGGDDSVSPYSVDLTGAKTFSISSDGAVFGLELLNRAYKNLAVWKRSDGRQVKFSLLDQFTYLYVADLTAQATGAASGRTLQVDTFSTTLTSADNLRGLWIDIAGTYYLVLSAVNDSGAIYTVTVDRTIAETVANNDDVSFFGRRFPLLPADTTAWYAPGQAILGHTGFPITTVRGVNKVGSGQNQKLTLRQKDDIFFETSFNRGDPTLYDLQSNALEFNYPPLADSLYRIDYLAEPETLSTAAQVPLIPANWHEAIWMIAAQTLAEDSGDTEKSMRMAQKLQGFVMQQSQELEHITDYTRAQLSPEDTYDR